MTRKSLEKMNDELEDVTNWIVHKLLLILIACIIVLILVLIIYGV